MSVVFEDIRTGAKPSERQREHREELLRPADWLDHCKGDIITLPEQERSFSDPLECKVDLIADLD